MSLFLKVSWTEFIENLAVEIGTLDHQCSFSLFAVILLLFLVYFFFVSVCVCV